MDLYEPFFHWTGDGSILYDIVEYLEKNEHVIALNEQFDSKCTRVLHKQFLIHPAKS